MLFNSVAFFAFAAAFFAAWPIVRKRRTARLATIALASLVFYGFWDPRYVLVLLGTGFADFSFGRLMVRYPTRKRWLLSLSLVVNLGALVSFKYATFFAASLDGLLAALGVPAHLGASVPPFLGVLPPGISFYTFQSMSYTIDVYRGRLEPTRSPLHFLAFISMFPQLVAGPIVRARDLLPALERPPTVPSSEARFAALGLIIFGYFKKVVIADNLAGSVEAVYGAADASSFLYWTATLMFAFQIYFDFSGYSDIARGLAGLMGYEFPLNFDHPYASGSFRELWQRWHISLSSWFRDYVYIPLGGSKRAPLRNLWITMLLSGLWHGASFTFLAWGAWHAAMLSLERVTRWPERLSTSALGRFAATLLVFLATLVGWVFFRAGTMGKALHVLRAMLTAIPVIDLGELSRLGAVGPTIFLLAGAIAEWLSTRADRGGSPSRRPAPAARRVLLPVGLACMICASIYLRGPGTAFIYFQF